MERLTANLDTGCGLPRQITTKPVDRFTIRQPLERLQHHHRGQHPSRDRRTIAIGHIAICRHRSENFERADVMLKRLKASRLDNSHDTEVRRLPRVDLLILNDFALKAIDAIDTGEIYELIVERQRRTATLITSNREPAEMLPRWPTRSSPNQPSTGSTPPPTNSSPPAPGLINPDYGRKD